MEITLRKLSLADYEAFIKAVEVEFDNGFIFAHYWTDYKDKKLGFRKYLEHLENESNGINIPSNRVAGTLLFAFDSENNIVGRSSIRHRLNDHLLREAGHIGYGVLPSFRRLGIATEILRQSLEYYGQKIGIDDKVLVTCDDNNIGSIGTIEKNQGVLWDKLNLNPEKPLKRRYWIQINE